ncbi:MAG: hypothetical protein KJ601_04060 [Nanoarchaeota archaeon]|nr:hypothetical protein [Nanoarchaeota archaeon]
MIKIKIDILKDAVKYSLKTIFYYKKLGGVITDINNIEDFFQLPFTLPEEVKGFNNFHDRLAVPNSQVVSILSSSVKGIWAQTHNDLYLMKDKFSLNKYGELGLPKGYSLSFIPIGWTGATLMLNLLSRYGVSLIQIPPPLIPKLSTAFTSILDIQGVTSLPYMLVDYAKWLKSKGIQPKSLKLKYLNLVGEAYSNYVAEYLKTEFNAKILDSYGSADCSCIGLGDEKGLSVTNESFVEIIDDELIITTLEREAMPLIRYRTEDIVRVMANGKPQLTIKVRGKKYEQMLSSKGKIFPVDIEDVIFPIVGEPTHFQIQIIKDRIFIKIETSERFQNEIEDMLKLKLGLSVTVNTIEKIDTMPGKYKRLLKEN